MTNISQKTPLKQVLQKVYPEIQGDVLIVQCGTLLVRLKKNEFIKTLFLLYETLIQEENELEEGKQLSAYYDTDFSGCFNSYEEPIFKIQDDKENGSLEAQFLFWEQQKDDSEEEAIPLEVRMNWQETKLWTEFVLYLAGKGKEVLAIKEDI